GAISMPDFGPIIREAYLEILEREADPDGLASYGARMNAGLSEAALRESLLRSAEYRSGNPDPRTRDRLGLDVHLPADPLLDDISAGLGVPWVRLDFDWFRIEPEQGNFLWPEWDRTVTRFAEHGVRMLATLAYTPAWASSHPANPRQGDPPAQTAFWTDF